MMKAGACIQSSVAMNSLFFFFELEEYTDPYPASDVGLDSDESAADNQSIKAKLTKLVTGPPATVVNLRTSTE